MLTLSATRKFRLLFDRNGQVLKGDAVDGSGYMFPLHACVSSFAVTFFRDRHI